MADWRDLLPATTPEERAAVQAAWEAQRARPGERKTVNFNLIDEVRQKDHGPILIQKNHGLPANNRVNYVTGHCPCTICGHEFQWECELNSFEVNGGCDCCSSVCT